MNISKQIALKSFAPGYDIKNMKTLLNWVIYAIAIIIAAYILPGVFVSGFFAALVVAIVLGLINAFIRPVLLLLTLPVNVLTLGLFTLVINALLVLLASAIVPGFVVTGFWSALLFAVVLALVSWALHSITSDVGYFERRHQTH